MALLLVRFPQPCLHIEITHEKKNNLKKINALGAVARNSVLIDLSLAKRQGILNASMFLSFVFCFQQVAKFVNN